MCNHTSRHAVQTHSDDHEACIDGANVDAICAAAITLWTRNREMSERSPAVYALKGAFRLDDLLVAIRSARRSVFTACDPGEDPNDPCAVAGCNAPEPIFRVMPYAAWHAAASAHCCADPAHPLAALLPHLDPHEPPLHAELAGAELLSSRCRGVLGDGMSLRTVGVSGFDAFARRLAESCFPIGQHDESG